MAASAAIETRVPAPAPALRVWPGGVALLAQWLGMFVMPRLFPDSGTAAVLVGLAAGVGVLVWWLAFSRVPWLDRIAALPLIAAGAVVTYRIVHPSIVNGMMGMMPVLFLSPLVSAALVATAAVGRRSSPGARRATMVAGIAAACAALALVRTDGIRGNAVSDLDWRWTPTAEERLLAAAEVLPSSPPTSAPASEPSAAAPADAAPETQTAADRSTPPSAAPAVQDRAADQGLATDIASTPAGATADHSERALAPAIAEDLEGGAEWPGFRGPRRDSVVRASRLSRDWSASAPIELWRRPVGPGWSSFAVQGNRIYTQEQRGEHEVVSAYRLDTGDPIWQHRDATRFWESNGGAGPRATPTLSGGRLFTLGANGTLNALDARDGSVIWSRSATSDTQRRVPDWGIASSPLVVDRAVILATAGTLAAYDTASGEPRWFGPRGGSGYSSPHLFRVGETTQIVLVDGRGAVAVEPKEGAVLWSHEYPGDGITQPAVLPDGGLLLGSGSGIASNNGTRRLSVVRDGPSWAVQERWTSRGLKPYFNDFVVHEGHVFGFDGSILACIDLETGERVWKGGRYGHGQLILLADQDLLLVLSEEGELALVDAKPDGFVEVARARALEGKTWNHPVLVGDVLLVRNGEEMAAFRLPQEQ